MKKILVVNDCRLERRIMKDLLIQMNYSVESSNDISSIEAIERFRPDILIANQTMDYIQGTDLIRLVKDKYTDTRCYLSSCSQLQQSALDNDVDGYFQTPISPEDLDLILREDYIPTQTTNNPASKSPTTFRLDKESSKKEIRTKNRLSFCPFCGEHILDQPETIVFCPFCGSKLP
ncbi:MAG: response regulator [Bacillota bacterium]|nr:response regulator [Bacillota bacterium]